MIPYTPSSFRSRCWYSTVPFAAYWFIYFPLAVSPHISFSFFFLSFLFFIFFLSFPPSSHKIPILSIPYVLRLPGMHRAREPEICQASRHRCAHGGRAHPGSQAGTSDVPGGWGAQPTVAECATSATCQASPYVFTSTHTQTKTCRRTCKNNRTGGRV